VEVAILRGLGYLIPRKADKFHRHRSMVNFKHKDNVVESQITSQPKSCLHIRPVEKGSSVCPSRGLVL